MDYSTVSEIVKYAFVVIVYLFIFSISRMIYLDIADAKRREGTSGKGYAYLKLVNLRRNLSFKMHESYSIKEVAYIGRSKKCQIYIDDPHMSKSHARIFLRDGHFYIEDLGSTNGSYLNGRKLPRQAIRLKDTDKLTFGNISFIFVDNMGSES
ncbi:MAG: FHA domain-containing protein [Clostridia bacterium]|nr:FHA domain-containing protein [Clostridia bacterium]